MMKEKIKKIEKQRLELRRELPDTLDQDKRREKILKINIMDCQLKLYKFNQNHLKS